MSLRLSYALVVTILCFIGAQGTNGAHDSHCAGESIAKGSMSYCQRNENNCFQDISNLIIFIVRLQNFNEL